MDNGIKNFLKENKYELMFVIGFIIVLSIVVLPVVYYGKNHPTVCTSFKTVSKIVELNYRDATLEMSDGTLYNVNQATLKTGDTICVNWEQK